MRFETFSEIFTYVGEAPEPTPEEKEELKKTLEAAKRDRDRTNERIRLGLRLDGSKDTI